MNIQKIVFLVAFVVLTACAPSPATTLLLSEHYLPIPEEVLDRMDHTVSFSVILLGRAMSAQLAFGNPGAIEYEDLSERLVEDASQFALYENEQSNLYVVTAPYDEGESAPPDDQVLSGDKEQMELEGAIKVTLSSDIFIPEGQQVRMGIVHCSESDSCQWWLKPFTLSRR